MYKSQLNCKGRLVVRRPVPFIEESPPVPCGLRESAHADDGECGECAEREPSTDDGRFLHGNSFETNGP